MKTKLYQLILFLPLFSAAQSNLASSATNEKNKIPTHSDRLQILQEEIV
ncbi:MAG: hypothetical protein U0073_05230 [Bacteroidia bacterium]